MTTKGLSRPLSVVLIRLWLFPGAEYLHPMWTTHGKNFWHTWEFACLLINYRAYFHHVCSGCSALTRASVRDNTVPFPITSARFSFEQTCFPVSQRVIRSVLLCLLCPLADFLDTPKDNPCLIWSLEFGLTPALCHTLLLLKYHFIQRNSRRNNFLRWLFYCGVSQPASVMILKRVIPHLRLL